VKLDSGYERWVTRTVVHTTYHGDDYTTIERSHSCIIITYVLSDIFWAAMQPRKRLTDSQFT
jgi:hypothetical protein